MVTQLLFGEPYRVLEESADWLRIRTAFEDYQCWISIKQHTRLSDQGYLALEKATPVYAGDLVQAVNLEGKKTFPVTMGASVTICDLKSEHMGFTTEGHVIKVDKPGSVQSIIDTAFLYLHAPYLWGGKTPFGIDCSGFTQMVFKLNGYKLPRDAYQQVEGGEPLSFVEEARAGDVAFFDNEAGKITHVGILLDNQRIIHASGSVRIDKFDHYGIFNPDIKGYSHHLRVIKRLV
jgi:cell wall-associated NlpC family hydrolase